jgi:class 3 adenylate cyclase/TolB-like protein/Tfp pilus assembly protein PilF
MAHDATEHRQLAAVMFTDMVGYSALAQRNEALALEVLEEHRRLVRPLFTNHGGREIKTIGDAFMVEFASPVEAARCAIAMQRLLHGRNADAPPERQLRIRIGLHLGDVVHREGDVYGDGVNIAARIEPLAEPGGICLTQQVYDQVWNKLDLPLVKLGRADLKNIQSPINIYRVLLAWQTRHSSLLDRLRFLLRQRRSRSWVVASLVLLVFAGIVSEVFFTPTVPGKRGPGAAGIESLAVLPLESFSGDPNKDWFAEAMTDELLRTLSKIRSLKRVPPRTSVARYRKTAKSAPEIARELGVDALVEGSVLLAEDEVRITVRLIEGPTDRQLWADSYSNRAARIVSLQGEVALAIAQEIGLALTPQERFQSAKRPTESPEAYLLYLQGRHWWELRGQPGALDKAVDYFNRAIALDPQYALAYAGLADVFVQRGSWEVGELPPGLAFPKANEFAQKAMQIDETLAEPHATMGHFYTHYEWNWPAAEREFQRAIELDPKNGNTRHWYSHLLIIRNRLDESLAQSDKYQELSPQDRTAHVHLAAHYRWAHEHDQALAQVHKTLTLFPDFHWAYWDLAWCHEQKGRFSDAIAASEKAVELSGTNTVMLTGLGYIYGRAGRSAEARKVLRELEERSQRGMYVNPFERAVIYAGLGQKEDALDWLEKAYAERSAWIPYLKVEPTLGSLREETRFKELVRKMGLAD